MAAAAGLGPALAANALGLEPEAAVATGGGLDVFQELLNLTCGHVPTRLAGETPRFDLGAPRLVAFDAAGWIALQGDADTLDILVEGRPLLLRLQLAD